MAQMVPDYELKAYLLFSNKIFSAKHNDSSSGTQSYKSFFSFNWSYAEFSTNERA